MEVLSICAPLFEAKTEEEWIRALEKLAVLYGFEHFLFALTPVAKTAAVGRFLQTTFPPRWRKYFEQQCMAGSDPTVTHCRTKVTPRAWDPEIFSTSQQKRIYAAAATDGLRTGVLLPIHAPHSVTGMFVLTSDRSLSARNTQDIARLLPTLLFLRDSALESGQSYFAQHMMANRPSLTVRELECLIWLATGKSSWDISQILEISEATVNYHIAHVCKKLGTNSRLVAAVRAAQLGLLEPYFTT